MSSIFLESENFDFAENFWKNFSNTQETKFSHSQEFSSDKKRENTIKKSIKNTQAFSAGFSRVHSLKMLLSSMKPSFLAREADESVIRQVFLWFQESPENMILLKKSDTSVLIGTAFSEIFQGGKTYKTFSDLRLPFSEKERIQAWILTNVNFDVEVFSLVLETLDFPQIIATQSVITYIRENIRDEKILEKIRFSQIFSDNFSQKIGEIDFIIAEKNNEKFLGFANEWKVFAYDFLKISENFSGISEHIFWISFEKKWDNLKKFFIHNWESISFEIGEIIAFEKEKIAKKSMKFTFDIFYIDEKSVATLAWYALSDRKNLSDSGVIIFTIEEDIRARTIAGHIFIDSRGFVHSHELMAIHKEIIKAVRMVYERSVAENPNISRGDLVQILRKEIAKYAFILTGRNPIIMPIIIEKKSF